MKFETSNEKSSRTQTKATDNHRQSPQHGDVGETESHNATEVVDDSSGERLTIWQRLNSAILTMDGGAFGYHDDILTAHSQRIAALERQVSELASSRNALKG